MSRIAEVVVEGQIVRPIEEIVWAVPVGDNVISIVEVVRVFVALLIR